MKVIVPLLKKFMQDAHIWQELKPEWQKIESWERLVKEQAHSDLAKHVSQIVYCCRKNVIFLKSQNQNCFLLLVLLMKFSSITPKPGKSDLFSFDSPDVIQKWIEKKYDFYSVKG